MLTCLAIPSPSPLALYPIHCSRLSPNLQFPLSHDLSSTTLSITFKVFPQHLRGVSCRHKSDLNDVTIPDGFHLFSKEEMYYFHIQLHYSLALSWDLLESSKALWAVWPQIWQAYETIVLFNKIVHLLSLFFNLIPCNFQEHNSIYVSINLPMCMIAHALWSLLHAQDEGRGETRVRWGWRWDGEMRASVRVRYRV